MNHNESPLNNHHKDNLFLSELKAIQGDNNKFIATEKGHIQWSFFQLVQCLGYHDAIAKVENVLKVQEWKDSFLIKSYMLALNGLDSGSFQGDMDLSKKNESNTQEESQPIDTGGRTKTNEDISPPLDSLENVEGTAPKVNHVLADELNKESAQFETEWIDTDSLFKVQNGNKWLKDASLRPIPKMLFDSFWYEGEVCILFADTNLGKSILAVQIGESIAKGKPIKGFRFEAQAQKVLYFDFELSDKQFEGRYSEDYTRHYQFSPNFFRAEMNTDADLPEGKKFEDYLNESLEKEIIKHGVKVLIIDNLTYLKADTEKAKHASPLMMYLKKLKQNYGLSLLILAHTPKRDLHRPITENDLQGSKMLSNFCDSIFAIGKSHKENGLRYLKQIKIRSSECMYHIGNVALCLIKKEYSFLGFEFYDCGSETAHLKQRSDKETAALENDIITLKQEQPELSLQEIAKQLGTYKMKVSRTLKKHNL